MSKFVSDLFIFWLFQRSQEAPAASHILRDAVTFYLRRMGWHGREEMVVTSRKELGSVFKMWS